MLPAQQVSFATRQALTVAHSRFVDACDAGNYEKAQQELLNFRFHAEKQLRSFAPAKPKKTPKKTVKTDISDTDNKGEQDA